MGKIKCIVPTRGPYYKDIIDLYSVDSAIS